MSAALEQIMRGHAAAMRAVMGDHNVVPFYGPPRDPLLWLCISMEPGGLDETRWIDDDPPWPTFMLQGDPKKDRGYGQFAPVHRFIEKHGLHDAYFQRALAMPLNAFSIRDSVPDPTGKRKRVNNPLKAKLRPIGHPRGPVAVRRIIEAAKPKAIMIYGSGVEAEIAARIGPIAWREESRFKNGGNFPVGFAQGELLGVPIVHAPHMSHRGGEKGDDHMEMAIRRISEIIGGDQ